MKHGMRGLLLAVAAVTIAVPGHAQDDVFNKVQHSLAVVSAGAGTGSGFVVEMDGVNYLVTNEHVARGGRPLAARLIDGRRLVLQEVEIAEDVDLIRFPLAGDGLSALSLASADYSIGSPIRVYGNSDGGGVVTSLRGNILGIGPDRIEIDARFVQGNSGSPIVDNDGGVVGVATYLMHLEEPQSWVKAGTRFNNVRRFGLRISNVSWRKIKAEDYFVRVDALSDIQTFCEDIYDLQFTGKFVDRQTGYLVYGFAQNKPRYRRNMALCQCLADVVRTWDEARSHAVNAVGSAERVVAGSSAPGHRVQDRMKAERNLFVSASLWQKGADTHVAVYDKMFRDVSTLLARNDWLVPLLKNEADYWLQIVEVLHNREP